MEMTFFQVLWFILIFVLIAGYFVLDGFDLGAGALYPFIAKDDREKAIVRRSIGPVWDGNEVWLLTAGGALFAAFPAAYATTFSGFYLAIMLVLFGLIVRAVSLEFRAHDPQWGRAWDVCFFLGSALPALLFGVSPEDPVAIKCGDVHITSGNIGRLGDKVSVKVNRNLRRPRMTLAAFERAVQKEMQNT